MADKPLGNLFVRVAADVANFTKGMTTVEQRANKTKTSLNNFGSDARRSIARAFGGAVLAAAAVDTIKLGLAADETASKFRTVFGTAAGEMQAFVDSFANAAGLTTSAAQEITSNAANIAKGLGLSTEAAAQLARQVTLLAGDLASFNNEDTASVARAITSALTGERESMKRLGVVIRQVDVDTRALADSGKVLAADLTEAEKVAATMAIAIERSGQAIGDLQRTNMEATGSLKTMFAEMRDAQTVIGQAFVPALTLGLNAVKGFVEWVQKAGSFLATFWGQIKLTTGNLFRGAEATKRATEQFELLRAANREVVREIEGTNVVLPTLADELANVATTVAIMVPQQRQLTAGVLTMGRAVGVVLPPIQKLDSDMIMAAIAADMMARSMALAAASTERAVMIIERATSASASLFSTWKSNQSFFSKLGSTLQVVGGLVALIPGGQLAGGIIAGAGTLAGQFAGGGVIPAGQSGIVGEAGPELVQGPAAVTPMGGAGGITINIVTESGRQLVDTIRIKDKRDNDIRRVVRVPIAAVATG